MTMVAQFPGPSGDTFDEASRRLRGRALLLLRLFEALSNPAGADKALADFGSRYEVDFWTGLRDTMQDIVRASDEIQQSAGRLPPGAGGIEVGAEPAAIASIDDRPRQAVAIAGELAREVLKVDLGRIIDDHQEEWQALVDAVRAERFPGDSHALNGEEPLQLYSKVMTTLPSEVRPEFRRLTEARTFEDLVDRHAAFELGRQIERLANESSR